MPGNAGFRERRRWSFAGRTFDEANWSLLVHGRRVAIESKPLEILRVLLLRAGDLVSKDELLDAVWPDVAVVEASLPTAVRKLRCALEDDDRRTPIIETVPRIGYRLAVPVTVGDDDAARAPAPIPALPPVAATVARSGWFGPRLLSISGGIAIALAAIAVATTASQDASASKSAQSDAAADEAPVTQRDAAVALRKLDVEAVERMIQAGWDPNARFDKEGTDAFMFLLNMCEWDRGHDRRRMLLMARTLLEAGADMTHRNVFGDTYYSIAKAHRYCGPDHPVTQMLEAMCYGGSMGPKDLCLATYELNAEQRKAQGLPAKEQNTERSDAGA